MSVKHSFHLELIICFPASNFVCYKVFLSSVNNGIIMESLIANAQ